MMPYELFISLRYLKAKRKQAFISLISAISVGGVAVGVAALIIVLAVMTGFKDDIRDKILGVMAHIVIQRPGTSLTPSDFQEITAQVSDLAPLVSISPYVSGQLLISSEDNVSGITLHGVDPNQKTALAALEKNLKEGKIASLNEQYDNLENPSGPKRDGILLGWELSRILGVFIGDEVTLVLPAGRMLPIGPVPKLKKLRVVGIFSSGFYEYDAGLAYISLTAAQRFFSIGANMTGIEIRIGDLYQSVAVTKAIKTRVGPAYTVQDWTEMNKSLFSAINLEKLAMFLVLTLIVLVAAFNIISTLVMMVMEKHADIATLKSMGATSNSIMKIFMFEGSVVGVIGTTIGTALGVATCWVVDTYKLIPLEGGTYYLDHLPFAMNGLDLMLVVISALLICFLSTLYPARQASKLDPVAVFRYE